MEQKQLDEIDESYFGDEFIDEQDDVKVEKVKTAAKKTKKTASKKAKKTVKKEEPKVEIVDEPTKKEVINEAPKLPKETEEGLEESKISQKEEIKPMDEPVQTNTPVNPWDDDDDEDSGSGMFKEVSTWKAIAGILVILLIFSVFTQGFEFSGGDEVTGGAVISLSEAEEKALSFVNSNLLQAPFVAELQGSEETPSLYKVTLSVAGETIDSYITKDGAIFFPQGFNVDVVPTLPGSEEVELVEVSIDDDPMKGSKDAPVTIIEFSEFQCPFCKKYVDETYPEIIKKYVDTGKVNYVFRDFPLDFHPMAKPAAMASECADDQGKYWEYHDLLFENQAELSESNLKKWAADLDLDTDDFNDCLDSGKYSSEVEKDLADGKKYGVQGTPGFFINGKLLEGAQPYSVFEQEIELALAAAETVEEIEEVEEVVEPVIEEPVIEEPEEVEVVEPVVEEPVVTGNSMILSLTAKKWLFSPQKLVVKKGDQISLTVNPVGLEFTFAIPGLGVKEDVSGPTTVKFTASKKGTFDMKCSDCEDWRGMTGTLVVE